MAGGAVLDHLGFAAQTSAFAECTDHTALEINGEVGGYQGIFVYG